MSHTMTLLIWPDIPMKRNVEAAPAPCSPLRRALSHCVGSAYTYTNPGEQQLDDWMRQHAFVTWVETNAPWELEDYLLTSAGLRLPLNLDGNPCPEAVSTLAAIRLKARQQADRFDIVIDSGGPRKLPSPRA